MTELWKRAECGDLALRLDNLPTLAISPQAVHDNHIIGFNSNDIQSRPLNLLRTGFAKKLKETGFRMVGVTSATPGAGKSFLTMNLGASLAKVTDDPVYLVDLDLRRATLAAEIGFTPEASVGDYLSGELNDLARIGVHIKNANLALFPATRSKPKTPAGELLANERFPEMIATLRDKSGASTILFDLPPAFADDDVMICLEELDAFILVVDSGTTTKQQVKDVLAMLQPTPCIGTVLNRYQGGIIDSYGYGYGYRSYQAYYDD